MAGHMIGNSHSCQVVLQLYPQLAAGVWECGWGSHYLAPAALFNCALLDVAIILHGTVLRQQP
jgi:hypothetical protein